MTCRKKLYLMAAVVAFALAACGGGGGGSAPTPTPPAPTTITTTLTSSVNPVASGQPTVLIAVVTGVNGSNPTGKVTFMDGTTTLGSATLVVGQTTFTTTFSTTGQHSITAVYSGDAANATSTSAAFTETVSEPLGYTPLVTSVPAPTYAAGSQQLAAFNLLNAERANCGFGQVSQSTQLDQAALAHANWIVTNNTVGHNEATGTPGFTGITSIDRGIAAGYTFYKAIYGTEIINFQGVDGVQAVRSLLSAPYHALAGVSPNLNVGIGIATGVTPSLPGVVNIDFGTPAASAGPQEIQGAAVLTYPCQGSTGVDYALLGESPSPVPTRNLATSPVGTPIVLHSNDRNSLLVTGASITNAITGVSVPILQVNTVSGSGPFGVADTSGLLSTGAAIVIPSLPLLPNTSYTVSVQGLVYGNVSPSPWFSVAGTSCLSGTNAYGNGLTSDWTGLTCTDGTWTAMPGVTFSKTFTFTTGSAAAL